MEDFNYRLHQQLYYNPGVHVLFTKAYIPFTLFQSLQFKQSTCFQYDKSIVYLPKSYKQYPIRWIIHEIRHYIDELVRGTKEMSSGYPDYPEHDLSKYFHHPTEMIAIIGEMQGMQALGWKKKDIITELQDEYEAPYEYFEALYYQAGVRQ